MPRETRDSTILTIATALIVAGVILASLREDKWGFSCLLLSNCLLMFLCVMPARR